MFSLSIEIEKSGMTWYCVWDSDGEVIDDFSCLSNQQRIIHMVCFKNTDQSMVESLKEMFLEKASTHLCVNKQEGDR